MSSHDDDILDLDFFEEDATRETQSPGRRDNPGRPSGGGPRRPRPHAPQGVAPLLRLIGLVAFAILVVVLLVLWAQGCSGDQKRNNYSSAMTSLGTIGSSSANVGSSLANLLTTPGLKQAALETSLGGLIQREQQNVASATGLHVPGPLRASTAHAIDALQLRVTGMEGLLAIFKATKAADAKSAPSAGSKLAQQAQLLSASDVVWQSLFRVQAEATLQAEGLGDITTPPSVFVTSPDLYSARSLTAVWLRVHGASTGGTPSGVHGTGLEKVVVQPAGTQLSTGTETTITASTALAFDAYVKNTGDNQEVRVEVTLTIPNGTAPIVKKQTIDLLDIGETKAVTFKDFPAVPFGEKTTVQVSVKPVPGETNLTNNSAEYPVIFSLG